MSIDEYQYCPEEISETVQYLYRYRKKGVTFFGNNRVKSYTGYKFGWININRALGNEL